MDLLTLTVFTVVLLLIAVVLHRWTWAGTQRLLPSLGTCLALGFVGAGIGPAETLSVWALQGVVLGAFLTATLWLVGRYDRAPIPMIAAAFVGLHSVRAILIAAHPYAVPGDLLGLALVLTTAGLWTWVLQRRQMAAATTATTE